MPGIFGAVAANERRDPRPVATGMLDLLNHRPWYNATLVEDRGLALGAVSTNPWFARETRLAESPQARLLVEGTAFTIDGRPVADDAPDLARRLLDLFLQDGDAFIRRIGGHFNLVVADRQSRRVQILNDRCGFAHMYWYADDEVFLFAPELKAFMAWSAFDGEPDRGSFAAMMTGTGFGDRTLFRKVSMLTPGSRVVWSPAGVSVEHYWRPEPRAEEGRDVESWLDEGQDLFRKSIAKRIPASWDGRVVVPLSGGLDSRLLLALAKDHGDRLEIFTHGTRQCTDYKLARRIADDQGLGHRHRLVEIDPDWIGQNAREAIWLNDGQLDFRNAFLVGVSRTVGEGPVPFLNGIIGAHMSLGVGGFCGEDEAREITDPDEYRRLALKTYGIHGSTLLFPKFLRPELVDAMSREAADQVWDSFREYDHVPLFSDRKVLHINGNMGRRHQGTVDIHKFFFHDLLPFVDEELHDLWLRIPLRLRLGNLLYQEMYRKRLTSLARIPWSHSGLDLFAAADEIETAMKKLKRDQNRKRMLRKLSFGLLGSPIRENYTQRELWLRTNRLHREFVTDILRDVTATGCDWFDQDRVDRMVKEFMRGKDYLWSKLMEVTTILVWFDLFQKNRPIGFKLGTPSPKD